jgi:uncharacterized protein YlxW (UPF0749 family)
MSIASLFSSATSLVSGSIYKYLVLALIAILAGMSGWVYILDSKVKKDKAEILSEQKLNAVLQVEVKKYQATLSDYTAKSNEQAQRLEAARLLAEQGRRAAEAKIQKIVATPMPIVVDDQTEYLYNTGVELNKSWEED